MTLIGYFLFLMVYMLTYCFYQYVALISMLAWAISSRLMDQHFQCGLLWLVIMVYAIRVATSRSRGYISMPEFETPCRKVELDPTLLVIVGCFVLGALITPEEKRLNAAHAVFGLGVALLLTMFIKNMGTVGQHANIYSVIPFIMVFTLCICVLTIAAEVFHGLIKATKFRPHVYVDEHIDDMTPFGYISGLFDTLTWFEGAHSKLSFLRL